MSPLTLNADECAALLKCSKNTVYELAEGGKLPGAKIGAAWAFITEDVLGWMRQQVQAQTAQRSELRPYVREDETGRKVKTTRGATKRKLPTLAELQALLPQPA
jgi:excisionase family DNA binding protein